MRLVAARAAVVVLMAVPVFAADSLSEARRLYNLGQYEAAAQAARQAAVVPATAQAARVVLGRIQLERFRQTSVAQDLADARSMFRSIDPTALDARERVELTVGLGEALYLEERFGAASEVFDQVIDRTPSLGPSAHDRALDWWATALDRDAQERAPSERAPIYTRIAQRMTEEAAKDPGCSAARYWIVATARGLGELDRAWDAAMAAWILAPLARDRGVALRADLERLVVEAIVPERAGRISPKDRTQVAGALLKEWEAFKESWRK
jgi:tetratricopeptide (TPR) repeat protein